MGFCSRAPTVGIRLPERIAILPIPCPRFAGAVSMRRLTVAAVLLCHMVATSGPTTQDNKEPVQDGKKLSEWVALLKGKDIGQQFKARDALMKLGPKASPALATLIELLSD